LRAQLIARSREESARKRTIRSRFVSHQRAANRTRIDWPAQLTAKQYDPIRSEIEALFRLRSELGDNAGESTSLAIRHALRQLARQVVEDERSSRLSDEQSRDVRQFVRRLAANPAPSTL
jgi:hypothetical protein